MIVGVIVIITLPTWGFITPIFQTRLKKLKWDYRRHTTSSWQSRAKTQGQSQGLLSTWHCLLSVSRQKNDVRVACSREADS